MSGIDSANFVVLNLKTLLLDWFLKSPLSINNYVTTTMLQIKQEGILRAQNFDLICTQ
jgi:hypothetical protein